MKVNLEILGLSHVDLVVACLCCRSHEFIAFNSNGVEISARNTSRHTHRNLIIILDARGRGLKYANSYQRNYLSAIFCAAPFCQQRKIKLKSLNYNRMNVGRGSSK